MKGWSRFWNQYRKDVNLWLLLVLCLLIFRFAFIAYFRHKMDASSGWTDIVLAALQGLRYDAKVVTTAIIPPFLLTVASGLIDIEKAADRFRHIYGSFLIVLFSVICVVSLGYFQEFDDQFNVFLYNFFYDDTGAIVSTIWSTYNPLAYLAVIALFSTAAIALKRRLLRHDAAWGTTVANRTRTVPRRIIVVLVILSLFVVGAQGTLGGSRLKTQEASVTKDEFLNKTVVNPVYALQSSYMTYKRNHSMAGVELFLPDKNVLEAAPKVFGAAGNRHDLDAYLLKHARGRRNSPPRHVFLIIMESGDSWPLLPRYASLGVAENLKTIARKGISFERFLPSGVLTMHAYSSILTGIPSATVEINYQKTALTAYPSSLPETFRRLGYRTRLFYGGFLSWQRIGDFSRAQGFDELYGVAHLRGGTAKNEWGVADEHLFQFAAETIDDRVPSFNVILTTSNHPPYTVDVGSKGFPLRSVPGDLAGGSDPAQALAMLGHKWYGDRCVGAFVEQAGVKFGRSLFALTGDHYGRTFIHGEPDVFERSAVPFVLYGPEVLKGISPPRDAVGSHIDIGPTLIELAAPKGFPYYSFGRNLLDPGRDRLGIGFWEVIGPDFIFTPTDSRFHPLPGREFPDKLPDARELKALFNAYYGLAWWRVSVGPQMP